MAELDGAGAVLSRFIWADGTGSNDGVVRRVLTRLGLRMVDMLRETLQVMDPRRPLVTPAYMVRGGTLYRLITDRLGTPRLVTVAATGAIAERLDVDEWGKVNSDTSAGFQPFGFAAGLTDADTGLVRFGARDFDPVAGRWTASDGVRFSSGSNQYEYALGDPIDRSDRFGTDDSINLACPFLIFFGAVDRALDCLECFEKGGFSCVQCAGVPFPPDECFPPWPPTPPPAPRPPQAPTGPEGNICLPDGTGFAE